jgi:hypothetical protein
MPYLPSWQGDITREKQKFKDILKKRSKEVETHTKK